MIDRCLAHCAVVALATLLVAAAAPAAEPTGPGATAPARSTATASDKSSGKAKSKTQPTAKAPARHGSAHRGGAKSTHSSRLHPAHATKGPPPPTWTIRPKRHQTPYTRDAEADGEAAPWNARWGCASPAGPGAGLAGAIGITDDDVRRVLSRSGIDSPRLDAGCVPYALLARDDGSVLALALLAELEPGAGHSLVIVSREETDGPFLVRTEAWPARAGAMQTLTLSAGEALSRADEDPGVIPAEAAFEVGGLVRALLADTDLSDPDGARVRVTLANGDGSDEASDAPRVLGVELLDAVTGRSLRRALWVDRDDVPGGYFTPNGDSLEPVFWANPVAFKYISRGVGAASTRRRASAAASRHPGASHRTGHSMHIGVDFVAPKGTPAVSAADGTVLFMGYFGGYGNLVIVEHEGGFTSHYGHLSAFAPDLAVGARVRRGTVLGQVGMTGMATGPHLHFEIRHEGAYVDPLDHDQPIVLWTLRRIDYPRLARQVLALAIESPRAQATETQSPAMPMLDAPDPKP